MLPDNVSTQVVRAGSLEEGSVGRLAGAVDDLQSSVEEGNYELLQQYASTMQMLVQDAVGISSTLVRRSERIGIVLNLTSLGFK